MQAAPVAELELDLEIFTGPFDLLLTLILREEIDLLEVDLADIVLSYLDVLDARGELDLEIATEFLVLIAGLLELKSRLMLPSEEEELLELAPDEALDELLERMLDAQRYRAAATHLGERLAAESGVRFRSVPVPSRLRQVDLADLDAVYRPARLGEAIGTLLTEPAHVDARHITVAKVSLPERLAHLRSLLRRGSRTIRFEDAVAGADRVTICVTLWALLDLYREGEARWQQEEPFGEILITSTSVLEPEPEGTPARLRQHTNGGIGVSPTEDPLLREVEALIFLSPEPVGERELAAACQAEPDQIGEVIAALREAYLPGRRGIELRELAGGWVFASAPDTEEAARRLFSKPRTPPLSPAQAETLAIVAYLQPVSRPEIGRIRGVSPDSATATLLDRGLIEEHGRSQFGATLYRTTPLFLQLFGMASLADLPDIGEWDPSPEEAASLRERLAKAGDARAGAATPVVVEA